MPSSSSSADRAASTPASSPSGGALARTTALVLAAGQGTRMKSGLPKVLHRAAGRPLVFYPVRAALAAGCGEVVVVVGHGREAVEAYLAEAFGNDGRVKTAVQHTQQGTGDAAKAALPAVGADMEHALVFYGDVPLVVADDLASVVAALRAAPEAAVALATCELDDPTGYGRVLRDGEGRVVAIREQKDATGAERAVREMNPGIYATSLAFLREALEALKPNNAQGEYYLTDLVSVAVERGKGVVGVPSRPDVVLGVNDRTQLAEAEQVLLARNVRQHRLAGVTVHEGARIEDGVVLGRDAVVGTGAVLRGTTRVGARAVVDVGSVLTDATVADDVVLKPYSVVTSSVVGPRAQVGPFSHLRPESVLAEDVHVGNFVETKKTSLGKGSKANHLAYLGDGVVGADVNVGAGTIFCNYDGFQKHVTVLEDGVFVGSDSQLVAPVTVGKGAYVGTGTTVTKDVPAGALALGRTRQENKEGYADRLRGRMKAAKEAAKAAQAAAAKAEEK